ncbi:hypothetical protein AB205_0174330 [Aquarana catesbeiana]|uniref:Uncharacterized protein n=1 Tax=Aquarana catesbeiana TaxID=8400 RepID=A0A2G9R3J6_AQUCT|nr:hypothetical protein AB205_0174330 [Aquarana catesbeiana]
MVTRDNACISDTIPVVFLLEQTLHSLMDRAIKAEQQEEGEDFLSSQGSLYTDTILSMPQNTQEEKEEKEEDYGSFGAEEDIQSLGVVRGWEWRQFQIL